MAYTTINDLLIDYPRRTVYADQGGLIAIRVNGRYRWYRYNGVEYVLTGTTEKIGKDVHKVTEGEGR